MCGARWNRSSFESWTSSSNNFLAGRAVVWELEGYGWRWGFPSAGVLDIQVRQDLRRQGLAKLMIAQIFRFLQDQFFGICELHAPDDSPELVALCRSVAMEQVDVGTTYIKGYVPAEKEQETRTGDGSQETESKESKPEASGEQTDNLPA